MVTGPKLPHVQIRNPIPVLFDYRTYLVRQILARLDIIQQHAAAIPDQPHGPAGNHQSADNTHQRVEPYPAVDAAGCERDNRKNRGQRIRQHMQIGGTQVVVPGLGGGVVVSVIVIVPVAVVVMVTMVVMRMVLAKQPGTDEIDHKPKHGYRNGLRKTDRHRIGQPEKTFPADEQSDQGKYDRTGKTSKVAEFAGTECKPGLRAFRRA